MKKAVILGASGGMGYNLVHELLNRENIEVVAVARNTEKMKKMFHRLNSRISIVAGDALHRSSILQACEGAEWIFHAINIPYPQWERDLLIIMENVLAAAKKKKLSLLSLIIFMHMDGQMEKQCPRLIRKILILKKEKYDCGLLKWWKRAE